MYLDVNGGYSGSMVAVRPLPRALHLPIHPPATWLGPRRPPRSATLDGKTDGVAGDKPSDPAVLLRLRSERREEEQHPVHFDAERLPTPARRPPSIEAGDEWPFLVWGVGGVEPLPKKP